MRILLNSFRIMDELQKYYFAAMQFRVFFGNISKIFVTFFLEHCPENVNVPMPKCTSIITRYIKATSKFYYSYL